MAEHVNVFKKLIPIIHIYIYIFLIFAKRIYKYILVGIARKTNRLQIFLIHIFIN